MSARKENVARDSLIFSGVRIVTMLLGICTTSILSHGLLRSVYGVYSQGNLVVTLLTSITILGFTDGVNYFYNKTGSVYNRQAYLNTLFGIQCVLGCICAGAVIAFQGLIFSYFKSDAIKPFLIYLCFRPLLNNYIPMLQILYVSTGKAAKSAYRNLIISLVKLAAVCITVFETKDIGTIYLMLLLADLLSVLYFVYDLRKDKIKIVPWRLNLKKVAEVLKFCVPMGVYVLVNSLCRECDKLVIANMGGVEALAVYTNSANPLPVDIVISAVMTVLIPKLTRMYHRDNLDNAAAMLRQYIRIGYFTTFMLSGACIVLSKEIVQILYGEQYMSGLGVFIVYILVDSMKFANITAIMSLAGKTKQLMVLSIFLLCSNIPLNIIGYLTLGLIGPAVATLVITIGSLLYLQHANCTVLKCSLAAIVDWKELLLYTLACCTTGIILYKIKGLCTFIPNNFVMLITVGLVFFGVLILPAYKNVKQAFSIINQMEE